MNKLAMPARRHPHRCWCCVNLRATRKAPDKSGLWVSENSGRHFQKVEGKESGQAVAAGGVADGHEGFGGHAGDFGIREQEGGEEGVPGGDTFATGGGAEIGGRQEGG